MSKGMSWNAYFGPLGPGLVGPRDVEVPKERQQIHLSTHEILILVPGSGDPDRMAYQIIPFLGISKNMWVLQKKSSIFLIRCFHYKL